MTNLTWLFSMPQ